MKTGNKKRNSDLRGSSSSSSSSVKTLQIKKRFTSGKNTLTKEAPSDTKGLSRTFMPLLAKACNGTDKSMGLPEDEEFWTEFAENLQEKDRETSKTVVVPETSVGSSNSSLKRANTNVVSRKVTSQSSDSSLRPELEMRLQEACHDLVSRNMLNLKDVAYAESILSTSTWASSMFLQQEDLEKRAAMIINARKNAEEKKKRRKMGAWL